MLSKEGFDYYRGISKEVKTHKPLEDEIVFGGCMFTSAENVDVMSPLDRYLRTYINLDVRKHLGISFFEYMSLTYHQMYIIDNVLKETQDAIKREEKKQEQEFSNANS